MSPKRFLQALTVVAVFGAIVTSSASAAMNAEGEWYLGPTAPGTTLVTGTSKSVNCSKGGSANLVLAADIAEVLRFEATGVECVGFSIKNEGGHGLVTGKLKFSGVAITEPVACSSSGGTITTEELKGEVYMDSLSSTLAFVKLEPVGTVFASVPLAGSCGTRLVKGTTFGQASNPTDTAATVQPLAFSPSIDTTAGGVLKIGGTEGYLQGTINFSLASGEAFNDH